MMIYLQNPLVKGAIGGALAGAAVDFHAFKSFQKWNDFIVYDWPTALFRWCQGAAVGVVSAAGLGLVA